MGDGEGSVASEGTENLDNGETWNTMGGSEIPTGLECCPLRRQVNELENKISREIRTRRALEEEVSKNVKKINLFIYFTPFYVTYNVIFR